MAEHGCAIDGSLIQGSFAKPLPVIGIYITGATLLCMFFMSLDAVNAIRRQKPWFPCNYFSLCLTLLTIATKLPVDINTAMPSRSDQLSKLSGSVLICTVMGNLMPSPGTMNDSEILPNIFALGIFVITVSVNVFMQMGTGVIYVFLPEHTIIIFFMLLLLMLFAFSALTVPTTKDILNEQYDLKFRDLFERRNSGTGSGFCDSLKREVEEFWMMAHSSSPQFVLGRSATCTAAGAFCLLSALIFTQAIVRSFVLQGVFCSGKSDYGWSTWLVFVSQALTVVVGSIAPVLRWLNAINFRSGNWRLREEFGVEKYWFQRLEEWKRCPFPFHLSDRHVRVIAYGLKIKVLNAVIATQRVVVWGSKFICHISVVLVTLLNNLLNSLFSNEESIPSSRTVNNHHHPGSDFVLHLEGEQDLVGLILQSGLKDTEKWIERGKKNCPNNLISLLQKSAASEGLKGILEFDSDDVPPISDVGTEKPPNCWALPVVTLTSIAVSLPHSNKDRIELLLRGVSEGLKFVEFIERNLDGKGYINMRKAAEQVWLHVDLYDRWFDTNLHNLDSNGGNLGTPSPENIIRELAEIGRNKVLESKEKIKGDPIEWPGKVLAAYAMYRHCTTILLNSKKYQTIDELFDWIEQTISDLLRACLVNLPRAIFMECSCACIEEREGRVRNAAYNLGEAENFLPIIECLELEGLDCDKLAYVDNWRSRNLSMDPPSPASCFSFSESSMPSPVIDELYIVESRV